MKQGVQFFKCSQCTKSFPEDNMNEVLVKSLSQNVEEETREYWCDLCVMDTKKGVAILKAMKTIGDNTPEEPKKTSKPTKKGK